MSTTHCVVKDCYSVSQLFCFPTNIERRKRWVAGIRKNLDKPLWNPTKYSAVCSKHFKDGDGAHSDPMLEESEVAVKASTGEVSVKMPAVIQLGSKRLSDNHGDLLSDSEIRPQKTIHTSEGEEFEILSIVESEEDSGSFKPSDAASVDYQVLNTCNAINTSPIKKCKKVKNPLKLAQQFQTENAELKKQMAVFKNRLDSLEKEVDLFQRGLNLVFGEDQISFIKRKGQEKGSGTVTGTSVKGLKWSQETVAKAIRLRLELSDATYKALLKLDLPFPSIDYLKGYIYKMLATVDASQDEKETEAIEANEATAVIIDAEERRESQQAAESKHKFTINAACNGQSCDDMLPNWFTKLPLSVRKKLCYPLASSTTTSATINKSNKRKVTTTAAAKSTVKVPKKVEQPRVIKLVPCDPPKFLLDAKKVVPIISSSLKVKEFNYGKEVGQSSSQKELPVIRISDQYSNQSDQKMESVPPPATKKDGILELMDNLEQRKQQQQQQQQSSAMPSDFFDANNAATIVFMDSDDGGEPSGVCSVTNVLPPDP